MELLTPGQGLVFYQLLGITIIVVYVLTVISVASSKFKDGTHQLLWLLVVLVAPLLGTALYIALGRKYRSY